MDALCATSALPSVAAAMAFLTHLLSVFVAIFAISFTVFVNYPSPPQSPILFQWQSSGKYFTFKQFQVFYIDETGKEDSLRNETLLCLHGFPTSSFDFYKVLPHLKSIFRRIIFVDFLGHGFSDKPRFHQYSIFEQCDLVQSLLQSLSVTEAHIWSHDYGDTVSQELIARQNEQKATFYIKSVSMMNGGIFPGLHRPLMVQKLLRLPIIGTILGKLSNYFMFRRNFGSLFGDETYPTVAELYDIWAIIRYQDGYRVMGEVLSYIDERHSNEDRWLEALKHTKIKLHFIYGELDPINPHPFVDYYKKIIPNPVIDVINNAGHYPHFELPEVAFNHYLKFLKNYVFS